MFKTNATQVILKENKHWAFYLVATKEQQAIEMQKAFDEGDESKYPFIKQVIVIGESAKADKAIAREFIPIEKIHERSEVLDNNLKKRTFWTDIEYKCYCRGKVIPENNIMIHEEPLSSLRCAIYRIGSPKYVYIVKVEKEKEFVELINEIKMYDATNNSGDTSICTKSTNEQESA